MNKSKEDKLIDYFFSIEQEERDLLLQTVGPAEKTYIIETIRDSYGNEDPVWWIENTFGDKLWEKQKEIVLSVRDNDRTAVMSCHGAGKSYIAAKIALWFLYTNKDSIVITTAPTFRQVVEVLWKEIRSSWKTSKIPLPGEVLQTKIKIDEKWFAFGFSTSDSDAFQGHHSDSILVVFDEASGVDPPLWVSLEGILTGEFARFLCIGNPTDPASLFKEECDSIVTNTIHISAFDTPNMTKFGITQEVIEKYQLFEMKDFMEDQVTEELPYPALVDPQWVFDKYYRWRPGSPMWLARVEGKFPEQGEGTLIPMGWIEQAVQRTLPKTLPVEFGCDIAYMGLDENVVIKRMGPVARVLKAWSGCNTVESSNTIKVLAGTHNPEAIKIDVIGYGAGVVDQVEEMTKNGKISPTTEVVKINVAEAATDPTLTGEMYHQKQFKNYRAELFWKLRERFETGEIDLSAADEQLINELACITYKIAQGGQIQIESKEEMRKRLGKSPDYADSLAYVFAEDRTPAIPIVGQPKDLVGKSLWKHPV